MIIQLYLDCHESLRREITIKYVNKRHNKD